MLTLNDMLAREKIDPERVLVLRHRPTEPELNKVFPWLAANRADLFNAYQQSQGDKLERVMSALVGVGYVVSFIAYGAGKAVFVSLHKIEAARPLSFDEYWQVAGNVELKGFGMRGFTGDRASILWFDLPIVEFYEEWRGKLIVNWPPPERSWWRRAHRNAIPIHAVLEESALDQAMKDWREIDVSWNELRVLPTRWRAKLSEWRGIYFLFDEADGKGYVGSAYGTDNLLGRWLAYAASGHGGNRLLKDRDPKSFHFTILELVSPSTEPEEVVRLENTWKERLHTRVPFGLNDN